MSSVSAAAVFVFWRAAGAAGRCVFLYWRAPRVGASFFVFGASRAVCARWVRRSFFFLARVACGSRALPWRRVFFSGRVCPLLALFFGALCVLRALRVRCLVLRACWLRFCDFAFSFLGWCGGPPAAPWCLRCVFRRSIFCAGRGCFFFCCGRAACAFRFCVGVRRGRSFFLRVGGLAFFGLFFFGRAFSGAPSSALCLLGVAAARAFFG